VAGSAAFFDLDKTLIATSATVALAGAFHRAGLVSDRALARSAWTQVVYAVSGADHARMARMREQLRVLSTGWDQARVHEAVAGALPTAIEPLIFRETRHLLATHRAAGREVVVISTSGQDIVRPVCAVLGVDDVIATRMTVEAGHYTGDVAFFAYGEAKAEAIRVLAGRRGYDLAASYAYSDSITDVPMLESVGHPVATNPDAALRRLAAERGWPVLDLTHALGWRGRLTAYTPKLPPLPMGARRAGVAAAVALATGAWVQRRGGRSGHGG
jgi:HAD superfamily hydrolase (TIGR01490 family)